MTVKSFGYWAGAGLWCWWVALSRHSSVCSAASCSRCWGVRAFLFQSLAIKPHHSFVVARESSAACAIPLPFTSFSICSTCISLGLSLRSFSVHPMAGSGGCFLCPQLRLRSLGANSQHFLRGLCRAMPVHLLLHAFGGKGRHVLRNSVISGLFGRAFRLAPLWGCRHTVPASPALMLHTI